MNIMKKYNINLLRNCLIIIILKNSNRKQVFLEKK